MAIILITHDLGVVAEMCDDVAVMYAGRVVERDLVDVIFREPRHPYTEALLRSIPRLGMTQAEPLKVIPGKEPSALHWPAGCRFAARCDHVIERCGREEPRRKVDIVPGETVGVVRLRQVHLRLRRSGNCPESVTERVRFAVEKIRADGKVAGTLVTLDELPFWLERGARVFHSIRIRLSAPAWRASERSSGGGCNRPPAWRRSRRGI